MGKNEPDDPAKFQPNSIWGKFSGLFCAKSRNWPGSYTYRRGGKLPTIPVSTIIRSRTAASNGLLLNTLRARSRSEDGGFVGGRGRTKSEGRAKRAPSRGAKPGGETVAKRAFTREAKGDGSRSKVKVCRQPSKLMV